MRSNGPGNVDHDVPVVIADVSESSGSLGSGSPRMGRISTTAMIVTPVHVVPKPHEPAASMQSHLAAVIERQYWLADSPVSVPTP
jgi:hypothetical protein